MTTNRFLAPTANPEYREPTPADLLRRAEREINERAAWMRAQCSNKDRVGIEAAWRWERTARQEVGLAVKPIEKPFSRDELANMPREVLALGLKYGFLVQRPDGSIFEVQDQ